MKVFSNHFLHYYSEKFNRGSNVKLKITTLASVPDMSYQKVLNNEMNIK
jgi:hypothetical protein